MNKKTTESYYNILRAALPNAYSIRQPKIPGSLRSVFLTDEGNETYVYKFNHFEMGIKNVVVSTLMREQGIHVPNVCLLKQNGHYIEKYNIIPGKTLYEHIGAGMPHDKVRTLYREIVQNFAKMSNVDMNAVGCLLYRDIHQVAKQNVSDVNNKILAELISTFVRLLNICRAQNRGIYHTNVTPKNIIVTDDGQLSGFVDMDEIAICNPNYAFANMAAKYEQLGHNADDLINYYEQISGKHLNRQSVRTMINLSNFGKRMLWKNANRHRQK